ncbi:MAG: hypothetical protein GX989_01010, partial [Firmicutes bacterium]|nr:hypothetical protein [Bacillota bacterium]
MLQFRPRRGAKVKIYGLENRPPHRPLQSSSCRPLSAGHRKTRTRPSIRAGAGGAPQIIPALILILLLVFPSTGCWDKKEIEDLAFLTAWGLDREEDNEILASAVIVKPFALAGPAGEGGTSSERPFWLAKSSGRTVLEAMCNFAIFAPRFIFCAHSRFVVFGEESARQGLGEMLDFFERNREPRLTAHLFVVKDMTAADFLKSEYELVPLPPEGGLGMLQNATKRLGTTIDININDFLIMLEEEGIEPVAGCWEVIPKRPVPLEGELQRE